MDAELKNLLDLNARYGTILTGTKLQEIIEENGQLRIKVVGRRYHRKPFLSVVVCQILKELAMLSLNWIVVASRLTNMETSVPVFTHHNGTKMLARGLP